MSDSMNKHSLLFSVIVCTYNREDLLADCLQSLANQTFNPAQHEVIVVDNNSSDNTARVAADFVAGKVNFRLVAEPEQGLSHARNKGLAEAQGEYVAFIDDDARAPENWLKTAASIVAINSPDIFGGPAMPIFGCEIPAWYKESYGIRGNMGETGWINNGHIVGTNIFFRKELLIEYGGFDLELGMKGDRVGYHEETALVHRAFAESKKVYYSKELLVMDRVLDYKLSLAYFVYSKYMAGYDGAKLWGGDPVGRLSELPDLIDNTMNSFDYALRKRDSKKYIYPENYIIEKLLPLFIDLGRKVNCFKNQGELENTDSDNSNECMDTVLQRLIEENGCWKTAKSLIMQIATRALNVSRGKDNDAS